MTDSELTERWEAVLGRALTHEEHVRIAFTLIRRHGRNDARRRLLEGTKANCEALDVADRFDPDLTAKWADRIADCMESGRHLDSYDALIEHHPELGRGDLLGAPAWKSVKAD